MQWLECNLSRYQHLRLGLTSLSHGLALLTQTGVSYRKTWSVCPTLLAPGLLCVLRSAQFQGEVRRSCTIPIPFETSPASLVFLKAMRLGLRMTSKFTTTTSAWPSVIYTFVLLCKISLDGFSSLIYKIANGYVMEIRHRAVVTYTSKLSSGGP